MNSLVTFQNLSLLQLFAVAMKTEESFALTEISSSEEATMQHSPLLSTKLSLTKASPSVQIMTFGPLMVLWKMPFCITVSVKPPSQT